MQFRTILLTLQRSAFKNDRAFKICGVISYFVGRHLLLDLPEMSALRVHEEQVRVRGLRRRRLALREQDLLLPVAPQGTKFWRCAVRVHFMPCDAPFAPCSTCAGARCSHSCPCPSQWSGSSWPWLPWPYSCGIGRRRSSGPPVESWRWFSCPDCSFATSTPSCCSPSLASSCVCCKGEWEESDTPCGRSEKALKDAWWKSRYLYRKGKNATQDDPKYRRRTSKCLILIKRATV